MPPPEDSLNEKHRGRHGGIGNAVSGFLRGCAGSTTGRSSCCDDATGRGSYWDEATGRSSYWDEATGRSSCWDEATGRSSYRGCATDGRFQCNRAAGRGAYSCTPFIGCA
ncbi:hypothetical protein ACFL5O_03280 [Myxococcota bacterium]